MTTQLPAIDVILNPEPDLRLWRTVPRELEDAGFHGVLCPDNPWSPDPFQLMAIAASATTGLRVGPHVLAAPLRDPAEVTDQTRSLSSLSGGRFGLGLGTGLPAIHEHAQRAGRTAMNGAASRDWIVATAGSVRSAVEQVPITVAAGGSKAVATAANVADEIALALPPTATRQDVASMIDAATAAARRHGRAVSYVVNLIGVGGHLVSFLETRGLGEKLRAVDAFAVLPSQPAEIADVLTGWRTELGIERVVAPAELRHELAAVLGAA